MQRNAGRPPVYDRAALKLTPDDRAKLEGEGRRPHWRFRLDQERVSWPDGIRGETNVDCASVSDPVLIREDGGYLYTLCSVCDDIDFGVTDVIRGEDHVTNTATQIQIFDALGGKPTAFAHHSLLVDADGSSLSKRLGSLTLESIRENGIEPLALLSYMARLGSSDPIEPRATHAELIEAFDLSRFGRAPARFSPGELATLNMKALQSKSYGEMAPMLREAGVPDDVAETFWLLIRENIDSLESIPEWIAILKGECGTAVDSADEEYVDLALARFEDAKPWDTQTWQKVTAALKKETGRKGRVLFMPLRKALTGRSDGPDMAALLPLLQR